MKPNHKDTYYRKTWTYQGKKYEVSSLTEEGMYEKYFEKKAALERGDIVVNKNTTVRRWAEQWLETDKKPSVKESTYINCIKPKIYNYIIPAIGSMSICDVKRIHLKKILNDEAGKSKSHVTKLKNYIVEMFTAAEKDDIIEKNPARFLELPDYKKEQHRPMTDDEYINAKNICWEYIDSGDSRLHWIGVWIMTIMYCGIRPGEMATLRWENSIDLKDGYFKIKESAEYVNGKPKINDTTKTEAGERVTPIPNDLLDVLRKDSKKEGLIFQNPNDDKMMTKCTIYGAWRKFKRDLDIRMGATVYRNKIEESKLKPGLKLYGLRHTAITRLVLAGAAVKDVQNFAGHADVKTTLNIYTTIEKEESAKRIKSIQNREYI